MAYCSIIYTHLLFQMILSLRSHRNMCVKQYYFSKQIVRVTQNPVYWNQIVDKHQIVHFMNHDIKYFIEWSRPLQTEDIYYPTALFTLPIFIKLHGPLPTGRCGPPFIGQFALSLHPVELAVDPEVRVAPLVLVVLGTRIPQTGVTLKQLNPFFFFSECYLVSTVDTDGLVLKHGIDCFFLNYFPKNTYIEALK